MSAGAPAILLLHGLGSNARYWDRGATHVHGRRVVALALTPGYVRSIATEKMGFLSIDIGCGRRTREDTIDFAAGFLVEKNVGDRVGRGEPLAWLCLGERPAPRPNIERELAALFRIGDQPIEPPPLAIERL